MGLSGSGKSSVSRYLVETFNAAWISSDTERQRKYAKRDDKYSPAVTQELFEYMSVLADQLLHAKYPVIIDSCAFKLKERKQFRHAAQRNNCPVVLLYCHAPKDILMQRIQNRLQAENDDSEASPELVELQMQWLEPPCDSEKPVLINIDTHHKDWKNTLRKALKQRF